MCLPDRTALYCAVRFRFCTARYIEVRELDRALLASKFKPLLAKWRFDIGQKPGDMVRAPS